MKKFLLCLGAVALFSTSLTSCTSDDDDDIVVLVPAYQFTRDGKNTVNYEGQNIRLQMVKDIVAGLDNNTNSYDKLETMFAHRKGADDFSSAALNASGKNVKSKIATSVGLFDGGNSALSHTIQEQFSGLLKIQANKVFPRWNDQATPGEPGSVVIKEKTRHITGNGYEVTQMFKKGTIGALILDQSLNNYLVKVKDDNNTIEGGANYSPMEHHWDEAYGYIFGGSDKNVIGPETNGNFPNNNEFIKYANSVSKNPNFNNIAMNIYLAFYDGRAAIVKGDYEVRDAMIKKIQKYASLVVAVRGVYYLLEGADIVKAGEQSNSLHGLSEGLGFVYSLQFTHNPETGKPYFTHDEVEMMLHKLLNEDQNGLWGVTDAQIKEVAKQIADKFGFTLDQAKINTVE